MKRELDEELCRIAPHLFADRYGDMRQTCMVWGFDIGDGWFPLLKEAALKLEPLCKAEYEKYAKIEKPWYKYIRYTARFTSHVWFLFDVFYRLANWIDPNIWSSPMHWYGGGPRASQIKEKYGTLRFYMTHGTDEMYAITDKAERQSSTICETCGKKGKLRRHGGWLYTRCAACWKREQHES